MGNTLTQNSRQLLERMIVKQFNEIDFEMDYIYNKADELITLTKELGLNELAEQLKSDKEVY